MPTEVEEGNPWEYNFYSKDSRIKNPDRGVRLKEEYTLLMKWMKGIQKSLEKEYRIAFNSRKKDSAYWEERSKTFNDIYDNIFTEWETKWGSIAKLSFLQGTSLAHETFANSRVVRDFKNDNRLLQKMTLLDRPFTDPKVIDSLLLDTLGYLRYALDGAKDKTAKILKITQQTLIEDEVVNQKIAKGLIEKNTWEAAKENLQKEFEKALKDSGITEGKFIEINGRNYNLERYSETVARTRIREAQTAGVQRYAEESGQDLVRVSDHSTLTAECEKYEGKIYSISGKSAKYPKLEMWTPFHPNCLHVITIYIDVVSIFGYDPYNGARDGSSAVSEARRKQLKEEVEWMESERKKPPEFVPGRFNPSIPKPKINYLLTSSGKSGLFTKGLGFSQESFTELEESIRSSLDKKVSEVLVTKNGVKYLIDTTIPNPKNDNRIMTIVWIIDKKNDSPRFISARPMDKKKEKKN
ncbi:phage minor capsid protein [Leptospira bandrabouensis]|uniref:phage minor capsid protein n=1 Tax=Leptospira bandrabouensis TaxID=2484903 RepID=UPI00223E633E|nr:phage minor capsid protein [Leptospira bandrabouensis]MCW7460157.1 phage minor capsid protein [Leptospira bandrabouensis]MCW7479326.1 phage minor capsid protein [Leptospira bandrabouensis]MCW7487008.1 phage minor capsid protein [Leptospira bandrabouensis]